MKDLKRSHPINEVIPTDLIARMRRSISRNEKAIVSEQVEEMIEAVSRQGLELSAVDATLLFEAACHKRGGGVSRILVDAGLRAHSSSAMRLALERGHTNAFTAQIHSIDQHENGHPFAYGGQHFNKHLLSIAMKEGLCEQFSMLLDKPLLLEGKWDESKRKNVVIQATPQEIANLLMAVACQSKTHDKCENVMPLLLERGADPLCDRFGLGGAWFAEDRQQPWVVAAFSNGNIELGMLMLRHCAVRKMIPSDRETIGQKCATALFEHIRSATASLRPEISLKDGHKEVLQEMADLGFGLPVLKSEKKGTWSYLNRARSTGYIDPESGAWLNALSSRCQMQGATPTPAGNTRAMRF